MKKIIKTTVIIPTLNEIDGVRAVLHKINKSWVDEIIIVDGGSKDGTVEYCRQNNYFVHIQKSKGYGGAILEGVRLAQGDIIIEFTADGSSLPEKIPELISKIHEGYDLVVASRYRDGAVSYDDDSLTKIGNWFFTKLVNLLFRSSYTDVLIGFRACRKESLESLNMDARGLSWVAQSSIRFVKHGLRIGEIPADEPARIGGKRKMRPFKTGWEILSCIIKEYFH